MALTNEQMGDALKRVITAIDKWWVEVTNLKKGEFYRYDLRGSSNLNLKSYIEWRYKSGAFEKDYISLVISLAPARGDTVSIDLNLRKLENGVYTDYDPFCWFQNSNYGVSIDAETGFDRHSMLWDFITINDINHLIDRIYQIIGNKQEDQSVEETGSNDEITDEEEIKMFGVKRAYVFDLKPGIPVRIKFKDMYGLESAVPTLKDILGSKMAEDKYCDAIVLSNADSGSRITLVTCNTTEDISLAFALDINDINNNKIELIELIPKEEN